MTTIKPANVAALPTVPVEGAGQPLARLTSLRAFAAAVVLIYHFDRWNIASLPGGFSRLGYLGVGFFFVLSGFILAWSTKPNLPATTFYRRRVARIVPSHLFMLTVALAVPIVSVGRDAGSVLASISLTQAWFRDSNIAFGANGVAWSLSCEAFFYLVFPLALWLLPKLSPRLRIGLCAAGLLLEIVGGLVVPDLAYYFPVLRFPEFLLGVVAGLAFRDGRPRVPLLAAIAAIGAAIAILIAIEQLLPALARYGTANAIFAVAFVLLILASAARDERGRKGWLGHRALVFAGEASFAFYLVHELVLLNVAPLVPAVPALQVAAVVVVASACAVALHLYVEKPMNNLLRK